MSREQLSLLEDQDWNDEIIEDIVVPETSSLVVYSRDWTVETVANQIAKGNIDLNPEFQRRNAWDDKRRSLLIESLILSFPVPEIVLAEHPEKKKSFIVIDGKQRLLTIAGFIDSNIDYWKSAKLNNLTWKKDLEGIDFKEISTNVKYVNEYRELMNADIRCTVISNFGENNDVLYNVFYRLNTGSSPLSTQELRQVLNRGDFANYLIAVTNSKQKIHDVLKADGPDPRMRDVEIVLRLILFRLYGEKYSGNLKQFLDDYMSYVNKHWGQLQLRVEAAYEEINLSILNMERVFPDGYIGRKFVNDKWEKRFNKVLFEVEAYYFSHIGKDLINEGNASLFIREFERLCNDDDFRRSIETTTKTVENYRLRYDKFGKIFNSSFGAAVNSINFTVNVDQFAESD